MWEASGLEVSLEAFGEITPWKFWHGAGPEGGGVGDVEGTNPGYGMNVRQ